MAIHICMRANVCVWSGMRAALACMQIAVRTCIHHKCVCISVESARQSQTYSYLPKLGCLSLVAKSGCLILLPKPGCPSPAASALVA